MTDEKTRALIAELREAHEDAGRIPQGTMVHDTQWRPFARLYNAAGATLDALSALAVPDGDTREVREIAIEGVKIDARGRMRHDSRVWYEALESALDALLPAFWDKATASALSRAAAPEPEWEYGTEYLPPSAYAGRVTGCKNEKTARLVMKATSEPARIVRRHKAGPWEPVGGES